jgi:hypothetical protein
MQEKYPKYRAVPNSPPAPRDFEQRNTENIELSPTVHQLRGTSSNGTQKFLLFWDFGAGNV